MTDLFFFLAYLWVKSVLHILALKIELLLQVFKLFAGFFFTYYWLSLTGLDTLQHAVVITFLLLSLVAFLFELHLQEFILLGVDGLIFFKFWF